MSRQGNEGTMKRPSNWTRGVTIVVAIVIVTTQGVALRIALPECSLPKVDVKQWGIGRNTEDVVSGVSFYAGLALKETATTQPTNDPCMDPGLMDTPIDFTNTSRKYLYYEDTEDQCAGYSHQRWSLTCALSEAQYLNRYFVFEFNSCLKYVHTGYDHDIVKDKRLFFDLNKILKTRIVPKAAFKCAREKWRDDHNGTDYPATYIPDPHLRPDLANETNTVIVRKFPRHAPYYYEVCATKTPAFKRDYSLLPMNLELKSISNEIRKSMGWYYDAVHIRRGDKVKNPQRWPNLDADTQPQKLLQTLPKFVKPGRRLYIATDEKTPGFFDPLASLYNIYMLRNFSHLWAPGSKWYKAAEALSHETGKQDITVFDDYLQAIVDSEVLRNGKVIVETFNKLTNDTRHGLSAR